MSQRASTVVVTGGAGFIGCNLADRLASENHEVIVFDNLSRAGSRVNLDWLLERRRDAITFVQGDVRDVEAIAPVIAQADIVCHLAAQTAVTRSILDPRRDFEDNVVGTFNVLEAARTSERNPIVVYSSTNKVYGNLEHLPTVELATRYAFRELPNGVSEDQLIDLHSPYGCSKGAADLYVRDYERIYGLRTVVFRQSCIYGARQIGVEDQGWVAWFIIALTSGQPITIFGDGKQVRDLLYIDDLVDAYLLAVEEINITKGQVYNIGGGTQNTVSVWWELKPVLEDVLQREIPAPDFAPWRPGDQPVFVADVSRAKRDFGWSPSISVPDGIARLADWVAQQYPVLSLQ